MLQQLATASASAGDTTAAQRYLREADELQRREASTPIREDRADEAVSAGGGGATRVGLWIAGLVVAAVAGVAAGYAVGNDNGHVGATTATVPVTVTVGGQTVTTSDTVTLPATTVFTTTMELTTTTETVTVTTTPAPG